jgi:hypothetical protein
MCAAEFFRQRLILLADLSKIIFQKLATLDFSSRECLIKPYPGAEAAHDPRRSQCCPLLENDFSQIS